MKLSEKFKLYLEVDKSLKYHSFYRPKIYKFARNKQKELSSAGFLGKDCIDKAVLETKNEFEAKQKFIPKFTFIFALSTLIFLLFIFDAFSGLFITNSLSFTINFTYLLFFALILLLIVMTFMHRYFRVYDFLYIIIECWILIFVHLMCYSIYTSYRQSGGPTNFYSWNYYPFFTKIHSVVYLSEGAREKDGVVFNPTFVFGLINYVATLIPFLVDIFLHKKNR